MILKNITKFINNFINDKISVCFYSLSQFSKKYNRIKHKAFTMAEALLVMTILGIIATVMVTVIKPAQFKEKGYKVLAKSVYSSLDNAITQILNDRAPFNKLNKIYKLNSSTEVFNMSEEGKGSELVALLKEYMTTARGDIPAVCRDAGYDDTLLLKNGACIAVISGEIESADTWIPGEENKADMSPTYGLIFVDTNGDEEPNVLGTDQFVIPLDINGIVDGEKERLQCPWGYSEVDRICKKCSDNHCVDCEGDINICRKCSEATTNGTPEIAVNGIGLIDGHCKSCNVSKCSNCDGDINTCKKCSNGYGVINGSCTKCSNNYCQNCDGDINACTQCKNYYGVINGSCTRCSISNCIKCDGDINTCTQCVGGYLLVDGSCQRCEPPCKECEGSLSTCTNCSSYYALVGGTCQRCSTGCKECTDPNTCTKCYDYYALVDGSCQHCGSNCEACTDSNTCTKCKTSYGLVDGSCQQCASGCYKCDGDINTCTQCKTSYFLVDGSCQKCASHCFICTDLNTCTQCYSGYSYVDGSCIKN